MMKRLLGLNIMEFINQFYFPKHSKGICRHFQKNVLGLKTTVFCSRYIFLMFFEDIIATIIIQSFRELKLWCNTKSTRRSDFY
jgi:hypothetical protein